MRTLTRLREKGPADGAIAELAKRQYGVVSREQLLKLGFESGAIGRRLRSGRLHQLRSGIYAVGHRLIPREGRWMAAVLSSGPEAALSHWSAAALWMIRPNSRTIIDVTVPHKSRSSKGIRRHHSPLPADEATDEEGIPVTTVPRTILDLAATSTADVVENLLRESEFHQLSDRLSLPDLIERYPGRRGTRKVRLALERLKEEPEGRRRSRLEERFAPFLRRYHLPLPRFNDWIVLGANRYMVDCHWPEVRHIVELDGWQGHGTMTAFREDRARDRRLAAAGYSVTRLTWNQLDDEPKEIAADLRVLLK
ncbi:MAG TPA: type IV toxin-antitoxin system AbiEi family antitoxin domain-containing protein [Solirubrobacterales bacterium]